MSFPIDEARPVRNGEHLDLARLSDYLGRHLPGGGESLTVEQFLHGHSNLTYLIRRERMNGCCAGLRSATGSRPPTTWVASIASSRGSARVYRAGPVPVLFCEDESILGAPFYLMERRRGVILRGSPSADRPMTPDR